MYEHAININPNQIVEDLRVDIYINESLPISKILVPEMVQSNEIDFNGDDENKIADVKRNIDGEANNARITFSPDKFYQEEAGAQGISGQFIVKYDVDRKGQESEVQVLDGYFVHYFVPENLDTLPKHAIYVLDVSGSMAGEKLQQLKDSMFTVLDDMTENDYFNIITFSSGVSQWNPQNDGKSEDFVQGDQKVIQATKENKDNAIKYVLSLQAGGGTNINDAMLNGLKLAEYALQNEKLPLEVKSMIVFLTDGLPSASVTNPSDIKTNIKNGNKILDVPIFCIGFGRDADFNLLKDISQQANSFSKQIYEGSDAALQLEDFFAEIASPLISNLKFDYIGGSVDNTSVSSTSLKTFFKGGEYIVTGKLEQKEVQDTQLLSIKIVGDDKRGPFGKIILICTRPSINANEAGKLLIPIVPHPPSLCIQPLSYPPRSIAQDFMQKLHAFINIKQLIKKSDLSTEDSTNPHKEKALKLSLENNFVTDLTSLVVIRPDEKPTISSLEKPQELSPISYSGSNNQKSSYSGGGFLSYSPGVAYSSVGGNYNKKSTSLHRIVVGSVGSGASSFPRNRPPPPQRKPTFTTRRYLTTRPPPQRNSFTFTTRQYLTTTTRLYTTTTTRPYRIKTTSTVFTADDSNDISTESDLLHNTTECTGDLTLFSKTYLRGDKVILSEDNLDLQEQSFEDLSVSASVSGTCCWQLFSEKDLQGRSVVLSSQETYTSVSSLGELFREVSSAKRITC